MYHGITHDVPVEELDTWRAENCSRGVHCLDEVLSITATGNPDHYLVCDACELVIDIAYITTAIQETT
jgi:hypothetical protein